MIKIEIPKETTFNLPEGTFAARIESIKRFHKQNSTGMEGWVRITFNVLVPELPNVNTLAGRNFKLNLNPGSELRNFLSSLLGSAFFSNSSGQTFDLERLVGLECRVTLVYFQGRGYEHPMVMVANVIPSHKRLQGATGIKGGKD